jgi:hypothetical protein
MYIKIVKGKHGGKLSEQDNEILADKEFKYDVLTEEHKRNNRVWFLVHWRDTFVVNGEIIYNHYP